MASTTITTTQQRADHRTRIVHHQKTGPDGTPKTEDVLEHFVVMVAETVTKLVQVPDPRPPAKLMVDDGDVGTGGVSEKDVDDVLREPIESVLDTFAADPAALDAFFAEATPAQTAELLEKVNAYQSSERHAIGSGIVAYSISAERLAVMDDIYLRARAGGLADPRLAAAAGRYVTENVSRPEFIERAFLEPLRSGRVDDDFRAELHASFLPLGMAGSHTVMEAIRKAGLLDAFLTATLRDDTGGPVTQLIFDGVRALMETGRLDLYAETLASVPITAHDPAVSGRSANHHFDPGANAVYMNQTIPPMTGSADDVARTLAHELFHAFNHAHGDANGAVNEGVGIAVIHYAFEDGPYSIAEAIYGSMSWYRDIEKNPSYPLGDFSHADSEMMELLVALMPRDSSKVALFNPAQLRSDYDLYWSPYDRSDHANWPANAAAAEAAMLAAR